MRVLGLTFVLLFGLAVAEPCHEPDASAAASVAALAGDVCTINSLLGSSPPDYVSARKVYEGALQGVTTAVRDTPTWKKFVDCFGRPDWMDDILTDAFEGSPPYTTDTKRVQVIKKVLQGTVLTQEMLWHLETAISKANDGDFDGALESMEKAMAAFYGVDVDCAPFGNGQARGIEFATTTRGVGLANYKISEAFYEGGQALGDEDASGFSSNVDKIRRNVIVIYIQSVAKYATLIDQGREKGTSIEKAQGEGFGYLHAILCFLSDVNSGDTTKIADTFNVGNDPTEEEAEEVLDLLSGFLRPLGIRGSDVKVTNFDKSRVDRFRFPDRIRCPAENPFASGVGTTLADADK